MRRAIPAVLLASVLLLAGCGGSVGPTETPTSTSEPTDTATNTTEPAATPTSTVEPGSVVEYRELSDGQQTAFRDAIRDEARFVPDSPYVNDSAGYDSVNATPFRTHDYVRYDGELYRITLDRGDLYASYIIRASAGSPGQDDTVVAFDSLPPDVRDEVRTAITDGEYYAPMGKWDMLPEPLQDADYVRYENQTYEMSYIVGDAWGEVLTVEKVA